MSENNKTGVKRITMSMKSKDEIVSLILNNKDEFKDYHAENGGIIDLSECDFAAGDISDIDFSNIDFSGASFAECSLTNVNFTGCDLTSANFSRANVSECDFSESVLNGTDFSYSSVTYSNFTDADMAGCVLNEAELSDSDFSASTNMSACRFDEGTIWPDSDKLPEDFDSTYNYDLSSLQDEEDTRGEDFGY